MVSGSPLCPFIAVSTQEPSDPIISTPVHSFPNDLSHHWAWGLNSLPGLRGPPCTWPLVRSQTDLTCALSCSLSFSHFASLLDLEHTKFLQTQGFALAVFGLWHSLPSDWIYVLSLSLGFQLKSHNLTGVLSLPKPAPSPKHIPICFSFFFLPLYLVSFFFVVLISPWNNITYVCCFLVWFTVSSTVL